MKTRITIKDIAKELKITPATVSRALSNHPEINSQTKEMVKATAKRLNYTPNRTASALQSGKSQLIGVMIPSAEHPFFGAVIHGISNLAGSHNYDVLIYQSNESKEYEEKGLNAFIRANVDGIIISLAKGTTDFNHIFKVREQQIPIVFFDRTADGLDFPSVTVDDYQGAYQATRHLIDQGYERIAHVAGPQHIQAFNRRKQGYLDALRDSNLNVLDGYILEGEISLLSGEKAFTILNSLSLQPDAVFAVEDFTALGVIKAAKESGIDVPRDLGVFGFSNDLFSPYVTPSISTVDQQNLQMGETAFHLLLDILQGKTASAGTMNSVVLEPIMIYRNSSRKRG
jgi:LacI family transcriptional regulator